MQLKPLFFQPKLTVNQPNDVYEREADLMADKVMRMVDLSHNENAFFKPAVNHVQRKCQHCEEEEKLHRKESSDTDVQGSSELDSYVSTLGSSGQRLSETSRTFFEPRFGQDFSNVRLHNDSVAAKSAQSINALAYTAGNNIVFNQGQYSPDSEIGKRLMAHELTHVVQQGKGANVKTLAINIGGYAYAYWEYKCLKSCNTPMIEATVGNDGNSGFRLWYYYQTKKPVKSKAWDAFGHCFVGCYSKKKCGSIASYLSGRSREFYREHFDFFKGHDSYTQDVNNQELGRELAENENIDCAIACQNEALPGGKMDLTAPLSTEWKPGGVPYADPEIPAPAPISTIPFAVIPPETTPKKILPLPNKYDSEGQSLPGGLR